MRDVRAVEFDSESMRNENGRAVFRNSERAETMGLRVPSAKKSYLAAREEYFPGLEQGNSDLFWTATYHGADQMRGCLRF